MSVATRFFLICSEHAEGERSRCRSDGTQRRVSPRRFRRRPPIRSSPSAFAVGTRRKVAKKKWPRVVANVCCNAFFFCEWPDSLQRLRLFGACRRRTPRTRADLNVPKDASHQDPFGATFRSDLALGVRRRHAPKSLTRWRESVASAY